ncbi:patatin-like phospholipase family protein [Haloechinothrix sp. LS1_15]|uniref:patatin-like phospholipase family protein n=1 Tax=Haloechinothrix sp. LS1_15 TaxID=2652248 RepID=UPI00294B6D73|nr:patatin-like phospholipase family protein [Haloechinothrix sp. LS1_15]
MDDAADDGERVALVLSGGGARGAYEAGALSVLLPELQRQGQRPRLVVGSSVGALNATYLAATAHLDAEEAVTGLLRLWRGLELGKVIRPLILRHLPLFAARYLGSSLSLPVQRGNSLLDPAPLRGNLREWVDWEALRSNLDNGRVDALAVVCTAVWTGRTVAFCDSKVEPPDHRSHILDYVRCQVELEHVLASAAIPMLFPPVHIEHPDEARGWYIDGSTRLDTPLKPALDLGAERVVVVGTSSVAEPDDRPGQHESAPPSIADGAVNVLHGDVVDPLIEDMRMLGNVNMFFAEGAPGAHRYRRARGKPAYRQVPYIFVGPPRNAIGELAVEVFRDRYSGVKALRSPDLALLGALLGPGGAGRGELLSYVFFDSEFLGALAEMGAADARHWLDNGTGEIAPWQLEPLRAFTGGDADAG